MKIKTKLFIFFIPIAFISHFLMASCLYLRWSQEIKLKLQKEVTTTLRRLPKNATKNQVQLELTKFCDVQQIVEKAALPVHNELSVSEVAAGNYRMYFTPDNNNYSWQIDINSPTVAQTLWHGFLWTLLLTSLCIVTSIMGSWRVVTKITKPIQQLSQFALAIASGANGKKIN